MKEIFSSLSDEALSDLIVNSSATISLTHFSTDDVSDRIRRFSELYDAVADKPEGPALLFRDPVSKSVRSHRLGEKVVVGRLSRSERQLAGSDLVLGDARMSKEHFKITLIDAYYVLDDLGSLNGTFVNNDSQPINESVTLIAGTMIRAGDVLFVFTGC
jgi:hypothetical protein